MLEAAEVGNVVSKEDYEARVPELRVGLLNAQYDLRSADFPVLVLLAGDDVAGCNRVLNLMHEWLDARHVEAHYFGPPSDFERERPRFWRYWSQLPRRGRIGLFYGAWAMAAVSDRVHRKLDDAEFERRATRVKRFERALAEDGALWLKFWLHLPRAEFKKRRKAARSEDEGDWRIFRHYKRSMEAVTGFLRRTSTAEAPWHVVESTDARYRDLHVFETVRSAISGRLAAECTPPASVRADPARERTVLAAVDLSASLAYDAYKERLAAAQERLRRSVARAREEGRSTLVVFEGWDAAGKGGCIRRITRALDARDYRVVPISAPSEEEAAHPYLWRFWRRLPRAGRVVLFDRSWYGRVLVERVEGFATDTEWQRAYAEINDFEEQLAEHGSVLAKFWLHIDPDEQLRRFEARAETPYKKYKLSDEDRRNRGRWLAYELAVDEMVRRTSTEIAPWHLVPANDKRFARVQVIETLCGALGT